MTCQHCCDADHFFDLKVAEKDLSKYRKKGVKGATKKLIQALSQFNRKGRSLLDIGGGIGAIQWDHLENGGGRTSDVDASWAYLNAAEKYSRSQGWEEHTTFLQGDFVDQESNPGRHDFVTLDKVVCCYPDFEKLLTKSLEHCEQVIALSFPRGGPIAKLLNLTAIAWMRIKGSSFRPYIHPKKEMEMLITSHGFSKLSETSSFPWIIQAYARKN